MTPSGRTTGARRTAASLLAQKPRVAAPPAGTRPDGAGRGSARQTRGQDRDAGRRRRRRLGGPQANWLVRRDGPAGVGSRRPPPRHRVSSRRVGAFQRARPTQRELHARRGHRAAILALLFAASSWWRAVVPLILIKSVLPLRQLRTGAVELTEVWLPTARTISWGTRARRTRGPSAGRQGRRLPLSMR